MLFQTSSLESEKTANLLLPSNDTDGISKGPDFFEQHVDDMHHWTEITMKRITESPLNKWISEPIILS